MVSEHLGGIFYSGRRDRRWFWRNCCKGYMKVTIWNHYINMEDVSPNVTRYTDMVDLYAGGLTALAAWWTLNFYKHRQKKWQKIAKNL